MPDPDVSDRPPETQSAPIRLRPPGMPPAPPGAGEVGSGGGPAGYRAAHLRAQNPDYAAGMRGVAEGSGLDPRAIAALNVRYEIIYYQVTANALADTDSTNFLIAQVPDRVVDIEAGPHRYRRLESAEHGLVHANHFTAPEEIGVTEPPSDRRPRHCHSSTRSFTRFALARSGEGQSNARHEV